MGFIVVFFSGCSLFLLLGQAYTTPKAFGLYFKGPSSSFRLATPYSIREHKKFPLNTTIEYRDDDVRLSELETGLSSKAESMGKEVDTAMLKPPPSSSSTPLHALFRVLFFEKKTFEGL